MKSIEEQILTADPGSRQALLADFKQKLVEEEFVSSDDIDASIAVARTPEGSYEKIYDENGNLVPTGINCLMALLQRAPHLVRLDTWEFERFAGRVGRISLAARETQLYTYQYKLPELSLSGADLFNGLKAANKSLGELGIYISVSRILLGAGAHGEKYEDTRYPQGGVVPTGMNCFITLLHSQPNLKELDYEKFKQMAQTVSNISVFSRALFSIRGAFDWPDVLTAPPFKKSTD